ncbi:MAG: glutamate racemase [Clostridiaceae bacterium]
MDREKPIGFFDSGVGGISVLKQTMEILPNENYIYFGDSINAPYGDKKVDEIRSLTASAVDLLLSKGCKAIVIACNTATSAAVDYIRDKYKSIPIIGIEPALKVAIDKTKSGKILVLATNRTLQEKKFHDLSKKYAKTRDIINMPLPGLVEIIEKGANYQEMSYLYLKDALEDVGEDLSAVVLGCTHYPFVKSSLRRIFTENIQIYDGSEGTARHLKEVLEEKNLLNPSAEKGTLTILNSKETQDMVDLSLMLLDENIK